MKIDFRIGSDVTEESLLLLLNEILIVKIPARRLVPLFGIMPPSVFKLKSKEHKMLSPEQVQAMIEAVLPCEHVEVEGDGHHFFAVIVSSEFEGKARLARHRLVKDGLKAQLASNELHALSIATAATPAEWAAKQA